MSDREESASRSRTASSHASVSPKRTTSKKRSRSPSEGSPRRRSPSRHRRRSEYSRSRSRSRSRRNHSSRSRSRSYDRRRRYSRSDRNDRSERTYHAGYGRSSPMSGRRRHYGDRDNPEPSRCLGVFGMNLNTQERDLRKLFEDIGPVENLTVVYDHQTGRSRGFAFVYMKHLDDAVEAKKKINGIDLDGKYIRIDYSVTERPHTPTPGVYLGRPSAGPRYYRRSPSPYGRRDGPRYSRSRSRSRSNSRRYY